MLLNSRKLIADAEFPRETVLPLVIAYVFEYRRIAQQTFRAEDDPAETQSILRDALASAGYVDLSRKALRDYKSEGKHRILTTINSISSDDVRRKEATLFGTAKGFDPWHAFQSEQKLKFELRMRFNLLYTKKEQGRLLSDAGGEHAALARALSDDRREHPLGSGPLALPESVRQFCSPRVPSAIQYVALVDSDHYGIHREIDELFAKTGTVVPQMTDRELRDFEQGKKGAWRRAMDLIIAKFVGDFQQQPGDDCEMVREQLQIALTHNQASEAQVQAAKADAEQLQEARKDLELQLRFAEERITDVQNEHATQAGTISALEEEKQQLAAELKAERAKAKKKRTADDEFTGLHLELHDLRKKLGLCKADAILYRSEVEKETKILQKERDDARKQQLAAADQSADLERQLAECRGMLESDSVQQETIIAQFAEQIAELEAAQNVARKLHEELQAKYETYEDELRKCNGSVERLTREKTLLQGRVDALRASAVPLPVAPGDDEFSEARADLGAEMEKLQEAMQRLTDERNEIANREEQLRAELETTRNVLGDAERLKAELATVQEEKRELENREISATAKIEQLSAATAAVTNATLLQTELTELQASKAELEKQLADTRTTSAGELRELREELAEKRSLIQEQRVKLARINKRPATGNAVPAVGQDVLERVVAEVLDALTRFDQLFDSATDREELRAKMEGLAASLRRSTKTLKSTFGTESGHQAHVKELQAVIAAGKARIAELEANARILQEQVELCDARIESVRLECGDRIAKLEESTMDVVPYDHAPSKLGEQLRRDAAVLRSLSVRLAGAVA
ncbi:hypothetical protein QKT49_gp210 [Acanthamoeba castellanii medusavirus]|uniref:Uncharacterized protein n=1 Tax=Acanthamoeba castellanii medusavirus J1 TaxID=3114988 RepID=A0A3T1CXJ8_9VIRU|nr:hypothetical protein QKT49_gp210 [Acanthamoeba castellanii medusavirus]BBI30553.1 hypothetical protein [Acanthamoeba castellanii medusavirus J1]